MSDPKILGPDGRPVPQVITDPIKLFAIRIARWGAKTSTDALLGMLEKLRADPVFRKYMLSGGPETQLAANASIHPNAVATIEHLAQQLCLLLSGRIDQAEVVVQEAERVVGLLGEEGPLPADVVGRLQLLKAKLAGYNAWKTELETRMREVQTPKPTDPPPPPAEAKPSGSGS